MFFTPPPTCHQVAALMYVAIRPFSPFPVFHIHIATRTPFLEVICDPVAPVTLAPMWILLREGSLLGEDFAATFICDNEGLTHGTLLGKFQGSYD